MLHMQNLAKDMYISRYFAYFCVKSSKCEFSLRRTESEIRDKNGPAAVKFLDTVSNYVDHNDSSKCKMTEKRAENIMKFLMQEEYLM
jgi:hypothetical protein